MIHILPNISVQVEHIQLYNIFVIDKNLNQKLDLTHDTLIWGDNHIGA